MADAGATEVRSKGALRASLVAALAVVIYLPALLGGPITDDHTFIYRSARLGSPEGLRSIWLSFEGEDYWPLSYSLFWVGRRFFDGHPAFFHGLSVMLHVASALLLGSIVRALTRSNANRFADAGLLASILFAVHPVAVEAVAWIIQLKTVLATALSFAAIRWYVRRELAPSRLDYTLALWAHVLSLLAKSSAVTTPVALLVLVGAERRPSRRDLLALGPFFFASLVLGLVGLYAHRTHYAAGGDFLGLAPLGRLALMGHSYLFYASKSVLPLGLSFVVPKVQLEPVALADFVPLGLVILGHVAMFRWAPRALFAGLLAYGALIFPVLGLVDVPYMQFSYVADHWQYGALGVVALGFGVAVARFEGSTSRVFAAIVVLVFAVGARARATLFESELSVLADAAVKSPRSGPLLAALGQAHLSAGRLEEAKAAYSRAVMVEPKYAQSHAGLGNVLAMMGRTEEAEKALRTARSLAPDDAGVAYDLGSFFAATGRLEEAVRELQVATTLDPSNVDARMNLGNALGMRGDFAGARRELEEAARIDPIHPGPRTNLGLLALRSGDLEKARAELEWVRQRAPTVLPARLALANVYVRLGRSDVALGELGEARKLVPEGSREAKMIDAAIQRIQPSRD
ncbi:MAG: tetratricopeptide repeat protein [Deltaproteobacteria bacterium]|nr:tetratricopeptide repeat protein [Deltaproteobacteria bacterium]